MAHVDGFFRKSEKEQLILSHYWESTLAITHLFERRLCLSRLIQTMSVLLLPLLTLQRVQLAGDDVAGHFLEMIPFDGKADRFGKHVWPMP